MIRIEVHHYLHFDAGQLAGIESSLAQLLANGKATDMKIDEALDAIKQVGEDQSTATQTLLTAITDVAAAVNELEETVKGLENLTPAQEAALTAALDKFRTNTQGVTDAAAAAAAAAADARDGTAT